MSATEIHHRNGVDTKDGVTDLVRLNYGGDNDVFKIKTKTKTNTNGYYPVKIKSTSTRGIIKL